MDFFLTNIPLPITEEDKKCVLCGETVCLSEKVRNQGHMNGNKTGTLQVSAPSRLKNTFFNMQSDTILKIR